MSLSKEQIDIIENQYLVGLYDQLEKYVISDIARRVQKTGRYTETAEIMARDMRNQGYSTSQIQAQVMRTIRADSDYQKELAENTKAYKQEVAEIIKETEAQALIDGDMLTAMAGDMAWNDDMQMWQAHNVDLEKDGTLKQITDAIKEQTNGAIQNISRSLGYKDAWLGSGPLENLYQRATDLAILQTATGTVGYTEACKQVVEKLARSGVKSVDYESGRAYHLDTAVRMAVRTGVSQLAGKVSEHNMNVTQTDLVYVDAHAGARPEHAEWQGAVYVYNKSSQKDYPQYGDFWSETNYGDITGLKGINCSHNFYPYWPGDVIPEFIEPEPVDINGKEYTYYDATQEQRRQEREIRTTKREIDAAKALGDAQSVAKLQKQLGLQYNKYNDFSAKANLVPKYERLGVWENTYGNKPASSGVTAMAYTEKQNLEREFIKKMQEQKSHVYAKDLSAVYNPDKHSREGYDDYVLHGLPGSSEMYSKTVNVDTLSKIILGREDYKKGTPVQLLSCYAGVDDLNGRCVGRELANKLGAEVVAPDGLLIFTPSGRMMVKKCLAGGKIERYYADVDFENAFKRFTP